MSTERFIALCYKCKLTSADLEIMTIGGCLDYIDEWIDLHDDDKKPKVKMATQKDIDAFFG